MKQFLINGNHNCIYFVGFSRNVSNLYLQYFFFNNCDLIRPDDAKIMNDSYSLLTRLLYSMSSSAVSAAY